MTLLASTMTLLATLVHTSVAIEVTVTVTNQYTHQAKLYWVNPTTNKEIVKATVQPGKSVKIQSHTDHTFVMRTEHPTPMHASFVITDKSSRQQYFFSLGMVKKEQQQKEQQQPKKQLTATLPRETKESARTEPIAKPQHNLQKQEDQKRRQQEEDQKRRQQPEENRDAVAAAEAVNGVTELQTQQEPASVHQQLNQQLKQWAQGDLKQWEEREQRVAKLEAEKQRKADQRVIIIRNQHNHPAKVYWVNPNTNKEIDEATLQPGELTEMNSEVNHKFVIRTEHPTPMYASFVITSGPNQRVDFSLGMVKKQQQQQVKEQHDQLKEQQDQQVKERHQKELLERHKKKKHEAHLQHEKELVGHEEELVAKMKKQHQILEQVYAEQKDKLRRKEKEKEEEHKRQQDQMRQQEEEDKQQDQLRQEKSHKQQDQLRQEKSHNKRQQVYGKQHDHVETKHQPAVGDRSSSRWFLKLKANAEDNKGFVASTIGIVVMIVVTGVMFTRYKQPHKQPNQILPQVKIHVC